MLVVTTGALALAPGTHAADPPTLSLSVVKDVEDAAVVVRATGTVDPSGAVEAYAQSSGPCTGSPSGTLIGSAPVSGAFTADLTGGFTPTTTGSWVVCGYVDGVQLADVALTVRRPTVSLTFTLTPLTDTSTPLDGTAEWVTGGDARLDLSGTAEAPRALDVYLEQAGTCSADPGSSSTATLLRQVASATSYALADARFVIPTTSFRICAYVMDGAEREDVKLRAQTASAVAVSGFSFTPPSGAVAGIPSELHLQAFLQVNVPITVVVQLDGTNCAATPGQMQDRLNSEQVLWQRFGRTVNDWVPVTLPRDGRYIACVYVVYAQPTLRGQATFSVRSPAGRVSLAAPAGARQGESIRIESDGFSDFARTLHVVAGPERGCARRVSLDLAHPGTRTLTPAGGAPAGPGAFGRADTVTLGADVLRVCAYLTQSADAVPDAMASARVDPAPPAPPAPPLPPSPPPGPAAPDLDIDPGPIPAAIGKAGTSGFYVNDQVLPPGVSGERLVTLARRSGERWGFRFLGLTTGGAAKQDGHPTVGFSSRIPAAKVSGIVVFKTRERPRGCSSRSTSRKCRARARTVERDLALSRRLTAWWTEPGHPPADRVDLETALLRAFGQLAGNRASAAPCAGSPLIASASARGGWWWRSPADAFHPECGG